MKKTKTTPKPILIKLLKNKTMIKKKILKLAREKRHYIQRNKDKDGSTFLIRNNASRKTAE